MSEEEMKLYIGPEERMARICHHLPAHMQEGAYQYLVNGQPPGGFLSAVLSNNFAKTVQRADALNLHNLETWAVFLSRIPMDAWGSEEQVNYWINRRGLQNEPREE